MQFDWIGFDADDTLWENEGLYREARARFSDILRRYGVELAEADRRVDALEVENIPLYGFGVMSFGLSLIEAAIELTEGRVAGQDILQVIQLSKDMIRADVKLLEGAEEALAELARAHPLLLITKGEPNHQLSKVERSGLRRHFQQVEVVYDKTTDTYAEILQRHAIEPARFLMVGNSLKSDILPVATLGGWAVHIPSKLTWEHELAEIPPDLRERVFEVEALAGLAGWVESVTVGGGRDGAGAGEPA